MDYLERYGEWCKENRVDEKGWSDDEAWGRYEAEEWARQTRIKAQREYEMKVMREREWEQEVERRKRERMDKVVESDWWVLVRYARYTTDSGEEKTSRKCLGILPNYSVARDFRDWFRLHGNLRVEDSSHEYWVHPIGVDDMGDRETLTDWIEAWLDKNSSASDNYY